MSCIAYEVDSTDQYCLSGYTLNDSWILKIIRLYMYIQSVLWIMFVQHFQGHNFLAHAELFCV